MTSDFADGPGLRAALEAKGVTVVDLEDDLKGVPGTYRVSDGHWTELGTEIAAKSLLLQRLGAAAEPYQTGRAGQLMDISEVLTSTGLAVAVLAGRSRVGAPLAGVLVAAIGPARVLYVDAGTFLFSALLIWLVVPRADSADRPARAGFLSYLAQFREGASYLRTDRLVLGIVLTLAITIINSMSVKPF